MQIGIPKEILPQERRVAANAETVARMVALGFKVLVEEGAGRGSFIEDEQYRAAGATVVADVRQLYAGADVVLKVKQPLEGHPATGQPEAEMLREGSLLVTFLHPANPDHHSMIQTLARRRITSFTMDGIPRTSRAQKMDALTSMSTITGYKSVIMAAGRLPTFIPLVGTAIGMLKPAQVLVVGAGVVGLQAIATAKRLGGVVSAVDIRPEGREAARSVGAKVLGFEVPAEVARGEGGYARALPANLLVEEQRALAKPVAEADIVILSALVPGEVAPILLTQPMLEAMRPGSVVVDVAIDQGGNCALTDPGKELEHHRVIVSGVQNIPGSVPVHATHLYAQNMMNYLENLLKAPAHQIDWDDDIVQASLVTRNGQIVHAGARKAMGLPGAVGHG